MKVYWVVPGERMRFEAESEDELDVLSDLAGGGLAPSPMRLGGRDFTWRECAPDAAAGFVLAGRPGVRPARQAWAYEWSALPASAVAQAG